MKTPKLPKLAYVVWADACQDDGETPISAQPLAILHEIGFLLAETDTVVSIGMEIPESGEIAQGRWRLHIPKTQIKHLWVFNAPKPKKAPKAAPTPL